MAKNDVAAQLAAAARAAAGESGETYDGEVVQPGQQDADRIERDREDDVVKALTELEGAQDARWKVYRILPADKAGFLVEIPTAQLSQAYIANIAGPGKYRVRGLDARNRYVGERVFTIAELLRPEAAKQLTPFGDIETLRELFSGSKRSFDWDSVLKWMAILGPIAGPILIEWFKHRPKPTNQLTEAIQAIVALKAFAPEPQDPMKSLGSLKDLMGAVKEMMPEGGETSGSTLYDIIRDGFKAVGPAVGPILGAVMASRNGGPPQGQNPQGAGADPPPGPAEPPTVNKEDPMFQLLMWVRPRLNDLIDKAAKGRDPELYADWLCDNMPAGLSLDQVETFFNRPDWWPMLTSIDQRAAPYATWFGEVRARILENIADAKQNGGQQS